jgi:hypothetical protein
LEFYSVLFEDNPNPDEDQPPKFAADGTVRMPPPPAIYVRDRMSSNGTYVDDEHHIGNPAYATPGYLLRHGQRVSILGEGFAWVFELVQPLTADLGLPDTETCVDNEVREKRVQTVFLLTGHSISIACWDIGSPATSWGPETTAASILPSRQRLRGRSSAK